LKSIESLKALESLETLKALEWVMVALLLSIGILDEFRIHSGHVLGHISHGFLHCLKLHKQR
jgi:hypothetical protein